MPDRARHAVAGQRFGDDPVPGRAQPTSARKPATALCVATAVIENREKTAEHSTMPSPRDAA